MAVRILSGDCRDVLKTLDAGSVQCCVTSPPYFGLRDYGHAGQIGLEASPDAYVTELVAVFREVKRVLRDDGTVFLNLGDSYAGYHGNKNHAIPTSSTNGWNNGYNENLRKSPIGTGGIKPKDLIGIPWRVAFALQADGWWLRSSIVWHKPNPMPESVTDRPTSAHEMVFLLAKRPNYYYNAAAIAEESAPSSVGRAKYNGGDLSAKERASVALGVVHSAMSKAKQYGQGRNSRNVWTIAPRPFSGVRLLSDYDDADGKARKLSADCRVHGHLAILQAGRMEGCGGLPDPRSIRSPDTYAHHAVAQSTGGASTSCSTVLPVEPTPSYAPESTADRRKSDQPSFGFGEDGSAETASRSGRSDTFQEPPRGNQDLQRPACSFSAMRHSIESHKTGLSPETIRPCDASGGTVSDTEHRLEQSATASTFRRIAASNKASVGSDARPLGRKELSTICRAASVHNSNESCGCELVSMDHFATMPPELAERCIRAGSRPGDLILDPFGGSGTTAKAADTLGRNAVLIELNPDYCELARQRAANDAPPFAEVS